MSQTIDAVQIVRTLFDQFKNGQMEILVNGLAESIVWIHNIRSLPYIMQNEGTYNGRKEVLAMFQRTSSYYKTRFEHPDEFHVSEDGRVVTVLGHGGGTYPDDVEYTLTFADVYYINDSGVIYKARSMIFEK
jgi:ketosteroid isomerase-like protein